ncbi:MAG: efflux RND transporter periplasmic adaptor subunit [Gemmatimonadota bacterium]|nr:MAG: efflux RND transporter periplasmic adaptor subunit [Gemmatimonadota bacterium]
MIKRIVFGIFGLVLTAVVVIRVIQGSTDVEPAPDVAEIRRQTGIPVEVATAHVGSLVVHREFTGTLRGIRSATIRARTGDEIIDIPVSVGQRVSAGDELIRQSTQGSMSSVNQAEAAHEQAKRMVERLRPLREEGAISEQDWDDAQTALAVAEANLAAARRSIVLTSPIDGIVTDILETRGTVPSAGDPLVRVSDLSQIQVLLQVSAGQARELALRQQADLPDHDLTGRISRIALQADPETRLIEVEATFPGTHSSGDRMIVPGSLVRTQVVVGRRDSALLVPRTAVREGSLWIVDDDGVAHRRSVTTGLAGDEGIEILEGLTEGERVVVAGASLLSNGAQTRIVGG